MIMHFFFKYGKVSHTNDFLLEYITLNDLRYPVRIVRIYTLEIKFNWL